MSKPPLSNTLASSETTWMQQLATVTAYASTSALVPALMNTPLNTSLIRPLVQSQVDGRLPDLRQAFSTRGWLPSLGRTTVRYSIADIARAVSNQAANGLLAIQGTDVANLTIAEQDSIHQLTDVGVAALMTGASQPLTALQTYLQVQQKDKQAARKQFFRSFRESPLRGSSGNFFSTCLVLALDRNVRSLIARYEANEISSVRVNLTQIGLGGLAGVTTNFLKTHAASRALGLSHRDIAQNIFKTAKQRPSVFAAQVLYAALLGGVTNKCWALSIEALQNVDKEVQARSEQPNG